MKTIILSPQWGVNDLINYGKSLFDELKNNSNVVIYTEVKPDFSNIKELFDDEEKLLLFNQFIFTDAFEALTKHIPSFKNVKFILSPYSSYEGLDLDVVKLQDIHYRNNAGANAKSVAQYAITSMFMLLSRFPIFAKDSKMPDGSVLGEEYHKKTAGIIGMGNVGQELLSTLNKLNISTKYFNRSKKDVSAEKVLLEEVLKQDIIFIAVATNDETRKMLEGMFLLLQDKHYLIDVSATDDLYDKKRVVSLLNEKKIRGYALEIMEPETFKVESDGNLIATPHIAWCTIDAEKRTVENYLNRAIKLVKGNVFEVDFIV